MNLVGPNSAHNVVPNKLSSLKQQSFILCTNLIWAELSRDGSSPPTQLHMIGCISLSPSRGLYIMATSRCPDFSYVGSRLPRHLSQEKEPGGNRVALHCLASEVIQPCFCQVLLIPASSFKPAQAEGEGERDSTS